MSFPPGGKAGRVGRKEHVSEGAALIKPHPFLLPLLPATLRVWGEGGKWSLLASLRDGKHLARPVCFSAVLWSKEPVPFPPAGMGRFLLG